MKLPRVVAAFLNDASRIRARCVVLFLLTASAVTAQQRADVFIVEQPRHLAILNQYQQRLSPEELEALQLFTPFRIIKEDDLLGDGFTECMRAEVEGQIFFLLTEDGALIGEAKAGLRRLRNALLLGDTIEIRSGRATLLDPQQRPLRAVRPGELFVRIAREDSRLYVRTLNGGYGWMAFDGLIEGRDWSVVRELKASRGQQLQHVLPRIRQRVDEVNHKLSLLYERLGRKQGRNGTPPQWFVREGDKGIVCMLTSASSSEGFTQTSNALGKYLETLLFGTSLTLTVAPGRIEIR